MDKEKQDKIVLDQDLNDIIKANSDTAWEEAQKVKDNSSGVQFKCGNI